MVLFPRAKEEWYKPLMGHDKAWITVAFIVALLMAITTIGWHWVKPEHQVPSESLEVVPGDFVDTAREFSATYRGEVVPEGERIYLAAVQFSWIPSEITLRAGVEYEILVSSGDVLHGLTIIGEDGTVYNLMIMPGMAYVIHIKFDEPGVYEIRCNEYCGTGHQFMIGKIIVVEG